jgi:hypothetical protein
MPKEAVTWPIVRKEGGVEIADDEEAVGRAAPTLGLAA